MVPLGAMGTYMCAQPGCLCVRGAPGGAGVCTPFPWGVPVGPLKNGQSLLRQTAPPQTYIKIPALIQASQHFFTTFSPPFRFGDTQRNISSEHLAIIYTYTFQIQQQKPRNECKIILRRRKNNCGVRRNISFKFKTNVQQLHIHSRLQYLFANGFLKKYSIIIVNNLSFMGVFSLYRF